RPRPFSGKTPSPNHARRGQIAILVQVCKQKAKESKPLGQRAEPHSGHHRQVEWQAERSVWPHARRAGGFQLVSAAKQFWRRYSVGVLTLLSPLSCETESVEAVPESETDPDRMASASGRFLWHPGPQRNPCENDRKTAGIQRAV